MKKRTKKTVERELKKTRRMLERLLSLSDDLGLVSGGIDDLSQQVRWIKPGDVGPAVATLLDRFRSKQARADVRLIDVTNGKIGAQINALSKKENALTAEFDEIRAAEYEEQVKKKEEGPVGGCRACREREEKQKKWKDRLRAMQPWRAAARRQKGKRGK